MTKPLVAQLGTPKQSAVDATLRLGMRTAARLRDRVSCHPRPACAVQSRAYRHVADVILSALNPISLKPSHAKDTDANLCQAADRLAFCHLRDFLLTDVPHITLVPAG